MQTKKEEEIDTSIWATRSSLIKWLKKCTYVIKKKDDWERQPCWWQTHPVLTPPPFKVHLLGKPPLTIAVKPGEVGAVPATVLWLKEDDLSSNILNATTHNKYDFFLTR